MFQSLSKKARSFDFELSKSDKTPLFALIPAKTPTQRVDCLQTAGQKRKADDEVAPDNGNTASKNQRVEPFSAPAPAGRSPKNKRVGILSRRRMTTSPFTRVHSPSFSAGQSKTELPFSIDAALAGTVPSYKSKSTNRKAWHFDIHEDTAEDEMTNLMEHSTGTLVISDDESRNASKEDKDNKENIPPVGVVTAVRYSATQITATRRNMMTDEPRNPLGDLEAKDFYAEGYHADSVIIMQSDDSPETIDDKLSNTNNIEDPCTPFSPPTNTIAEGQDGEKEAAETQIWESESAKGDDDVEAQATLAVPTNNHC